MEPRSGRNETLRRLRNRVISTFKNSKITQVTNSDAGYIITQNLADVTHKQTQ